jgi:hypothetical protein
MTAKGISSCNLEVGEEWDTLSERIKLRDFRYSYHNYLPNPDLVYGGGGIWCESMFVDKKIDNWPSKY